MLSQGLRIETWGTRQRSFRGDLSSLRKSLARCRLPITDPLDTHLDYFRFADHPGFGRSPGGRPELPLSEVHCSGHFQFLRRIVRGLDPVHLLKARENAAGSENPTR